MKLLILHNLATSYYKNILFNSLYGKFKDFKVIHLAETQSNRKWEIDLSYLCYPYEVLFKGNVDDVPVSKLVKKILKTLKKESFEIVYLGGYSEIAYWTALFYSKIKGKKIIVEMDSNEYNLRKKKFYKELLKRVFIKMCDYGITYGKLSKNYLVDLGMPEDRIIIKPNITDNEFWLKEGKKYRARRDELILKFGFKEKNFIYVGRFSKEKNLFFMLKVFAMAKEETGDEKWGLIIVGDGPLREELIKFAKDKNIKDVFFVPFKQKKELPLYYAVSDVFILPSLSEPWGIVINEAMASGVIPLVSERCGAVDLVENGKNGFIFNPLDESELKEKMITIMKLPYEKLEAIKRNNLKKIKKFFPSYASDKIIELLNIIKVEKKIYEVG